MRQSLKISLSLLIALVLSAAFSVLAFRGGFDYLQVAFFQPRVLRERGQALAAAAGFVERYHQRNAERFRAVLKEPFIAGAFSATGQQSREDIFNRGNLFGRLLEEYPNLLGVRFPGPGRREGPLQHLPPGRFLRQRSEVGHLPGFFQIRTVIEGGPAAGSGGAGAAPPAGGERWAPDLLTSG
jgi:hypothetical protein